MRIISIGIEMEGGFNSTEFERFLQQLQSSDLTYGHFSYSYDMSVRVYDKEIFDLELKYWDTDPERIYKFIRLVFANGFSQNESCGNHVHLKFDDTESVIALFTYRDAWKLFRKYYIAKFKGNMKYLSRMQNRYCLLRYNAKEYLDGSLSRYRAINILSFDRHGTLEIRILPHSDSAEELIQAIKWLLATIEDIVNQYYVVSKQIKIRKHELVTEAQYTVPEIEYVVM